MRVVSLILVLVMVAMTLASCGTTSEAGQLNPFENRFDRFYSGDSLYVFVDKVTGVCYLWRGVGNKGGMTVLLNADGSPVTWGGE